MRRRLSAAWACGVGLIALGSGARASYHLWGINEVYSDASGTVQFVEMATSSGFEGFVSGHQFTSTSHTLTLDHNLSGSTANKFFLMATPGYAALSGAPAPDFIFPNNSFFSTSGDTLSWVGAVGDGTHPASLTFAGGQVPTDGIHSMSFNLSANDSNSPTNFAGDTGTVPEPAGVAATTLGALVGGRRRRAAR